MPFKTEPNKVDFIAQEHDILTFWKKTDAFNKLRELQANRPSWSFVDGPITANNPMGVHHGWGRTYKDVYSRYKAMQGYQLRYQNGFDCQGLWVEVEVEKELGFKSKKDIEDYGLDKFVLKCKERVLNYAAVQTDQSIRLGYWMDWNDPEQLKELGKRLAANPQETITISGPRGEVTDTVEQIVARLGLPELGGSYFTFSNENNYMIWTFLKKCWENGWIYRGADVMPWCPRCATAISQHEIVTDGYAEITHRSVVLRFPLRDRQNESLLIWTTTPWTLTSNVAAAVGPELLYVKVKQGDSLLYLSKGTLHILQGEYEVVEELKGIEMVGWKYDGPFDEIEAAQTPGGITKLQELIADIQMTAQDAHQVISWDEVGEDEGTGIVHIATGCGAEDFVLGKEYQFPLLAPLTDEGIFVEKYGWLTGKHVSEVADLIFKDLEKKGILYNVAPYTHRYPTCWRCKTELVFRLVDEWFISMGETYDKPREELTAEEKARSLRYQIMDIVDQIRWIPEFGHAREMDWLKNMHDWMISKKRYWGLALPIWVCRDCEEFEVIGDDNELKERAIEGLDVLSTHTPHRPFIDAVKIACSSCGGTMDRLPEVGNPWLDAGVVPFSTLGYRQEPDYWQQWYPAQWISESFPGQFRNWFYSLLAMGTVLDNSPPFLENFGYATLLAEDGREMHKSWGNSIEFNEAADIMGVDVMRWLYCAHKPENNLLFGYNKADEIRRRFLIPLWNVYSFFTTYANLDGWMPEINNNFDPAKPEGTAPISTNPLDIWIVARLDQVIIKVSEALENSDFFSATRFIEPLIDDLTNWYIRRSRRRFWKSELDSDKHTAYNTLYFVLVKLVRLLAPFTPFVTEVIYQNLVVNMEEGAYPSVHFTRWVTADEEKIDVKLIEQMKLARRVASLGLSARGSAGIKVRQPLEAVYVHVSEGRAELSADLIAIVSDELNIKGLEFVQNPEDLIEYKIFPDNKALGPRFGAKFPAVKQVLLSLNASEIAKKISAGENIALQVGDDIVTLAPEDLIVYTEPKEGLAVGADKNVTVGINTTLTLALRKEGLAREIVRRIQAQRKNADFNIEDRITTVFQTDSPLQEVVSEWKGYIMDETLSIHLTAGVIQPDHYTETHKLNDNEITIGIKQVEQDDRGK